MDGLEQRAAVDGTGFMLKSDATADVVILGAGFSRAISAAMPLTDELGERATALAGIDSAPTFRDGAFEAWLSRLAEAQPYLSQADNTENLSRFQRLSGSIHDVMREAQGAVLEKGLPDWLGRFVTALHCRRVTVITFNYDLLIEHTLEGMAAWDFEADHSSGAPVRWTDALGGLPGFPPTPSRWSGEQYPTLSLLKLHGSLNWYWVPDDHVGTTLSYWDLDPDAGAIRRYLPGRVPFVVPPASLKSGFFRSPIMGEIWQSAARALRTAERVALVGYSMPPTDLVAAGMITDSIDIKRTTISVVNTRPEPVAKTIQRVLQTQPETETSVEAFATAFVDESSRHLATLIGAKAGLAVGNAGVVVGWSTSAMRAALAVRREGHTVVLTVGEHEGHTPTAPVDGGGPRVTLDDVARELQSGDQLEAEFANHQRSALVGIDRFRRSSGASTHWQVLIPADKREKLTR